jgi:hypothetical protein
MRESGDGVSRPRVENSCLLFNLVKKCVFLCIPSHNTDHFPNYNNYTLTAGNNRTLTLYIS